MTVDDIKAEIAASYELPPYFEWSAQVDLELELAAWLYNLHPNEMYWC
jgi:hypothetical protein